MVYNIMAKYFVRFLYFFIILDIILNISLSESYSQTYLKIDNNVIPLLTPPYQLTKENIHNNTNSPIINITYVSSYP
jgi:hypothetical protein